MTSLEPVEEEDATPPPIPRRSSGRPTHSRQSNSYNFSYPRRILPPEISSEDNESTATRSSWDGPRTSSETFTTNSQDTGSVSNESTRTDPGPSFTFDPDNIIPDKPFKPQNSRRNSFQQFFRNSNSTQDSVAHTIEKRVSVDQQSQRTTGSGSSNEGWKSSDYDTSGLSVEQIAKLKKKGINPALYAEMKASRKGRGKWTSPLVGNTFLS